MIQREVAHSEVSTCAHLSMCTYVRKTHKGDVEVTSGFDCPLSSF